MEKKKSCVLMFDNLRFSNLSYISWSRWYTIENEIGTEIRKFY